MLSKPIISVIMPAYNVSKYVGDAIQSILAQNYGHFELLIADDGSTDNTRKIIDEFQDPRLVKDHNEDNIGKVGTVNKLLKLAKGDFITFQDADDFSHERRLELLLNAFMKDEQLGMVGSNVWYCKPNGKTIRTSNYPLRYDQILKGLPNQFYFTGASVMVRAELVRRFGGYHEYFKRGGEDPYWVGIIALSEKFENLKEPLYSYRLTPNSLSRNIENAWQIIALDVVTALLKQRIETGTDDLEQGKMEDLKKLEKDLLNQYRNSVDWVMHRSIHRDILNKFIFRAFTKSWRYFIHSKNKKIAAKDLLQFQLSIIKALKNR